MGKLIDKLGFKECQEYNIGLWQCPSFLFMVMGLVNIASILATYFVMQKYQFPELVVFSVFAVSLFIFLVGFSVIQGVQRIVDINKARREFVSIASHQLRAPLTGMRWSCDILSSPETGELNPKQKEYLDDVQESVSRMVRLVNDLLDLSRIDSGKIKIDLQEVDFCEVARDVLKELHLVAMANNTEIELEIKGKEKHVKADPMRVKMVLQNFIDNAIKYIDNSKKGEIKVVVTNKKDFVLCEVKDNGVGISKEDQKKIFCKFFRSYTATKKETVGTGLGLYIAKASIENSGGEIGFSSVEGKGSNFWFTMPIFK